jgi:hypothetical protein
MQLTVSTVFAPWENTTYLHVFPKIHPKKKRKKKTNELQRAKLSKQEQK